MSNVSAIHNMGELESFARKFVEALSPQVESATVVGLRGELGSGKTAFTKAVAKILGVTKNLTSPTFVILKKYDLVGQKFSHLIHIDAYRLKSATELAHLGWDSMLADKSNLIMIEWPEIVDDIMPSYTKYLDFRHVDETTREIYEK